MSTVYRFAPITIPKNVFNSQWKLQKFRQLTKNNYLLNWCVCLKFTFYRSWLVYVAHQFLDQCPRTPHSQPTSSVAVINTIMIFLFVRLRRLFTPLIYHVYLQTNKTGDNWVPFFQLVSRSAGVQTGLIDESSNDLVCFEFVSNETQKLTTTLCRIFFQPKFKSTYLWTIFLRESTV